MSFFKKNTPKEIERYPENSKGDFYVENSVCISCGAPEAEAPDLIEHSKFEYGHCYFKKQPQTDDEIERAIQAIAVSCIAGLRYGGTDEKILKRLYEIGIAEQCDNKPKGNYKTIIWNKVTFDYKGSIEELTELMMSQLLQKSSYLNKQIQIFNFKNDKYFEFIYRWTDGAPGNIFKCYFLEGNKFRVETKVERNGYEISLRGNAIIFNAILRSNLNISEILWFDKDGNTYGVNEIR